MTWVDACSTWSPLLPPHHYILCSRSYLAGPFARDPVHGLPCDVAGRGGEQRASGTPGTGCPRADRTRGAAPSGLVGRSGLVAEPEVEPDGHADHDEPCRASPPCGAPHQPGHPEAVGGRRPAYVSPRPCVPAAGDGALFEAEEPLDRWRFVRAAPAVGRRVGEVHGGLRVIAERAGPLDPRRCDPGLVSDVLEPDR